MTRFRWFLIGCVLAGVMVAETAIAQGQAPLDPGIQRERAPGVPLAPRPLDVERRERQIGETITAPMPPARSELHVRAMPAPDRDPPMPKPVPSIMAP